MLFPILSAKIFSHLLKNCLDMRFVCEVVSDSLLCSYIYTMSVFIMPFARHFLVSQLHAPVGSPLVDVTLKDKDCVCV